MGKLLKSVSSKLGRWAHLRPIAKKIATGERN
jgi:hypothetical protein